MKTGSQNKVILKITLLRSLKNKQGQVVLKRTHNEGQAHDTYYVYDDFGNLTYVLSPAASDSVVDSSDTIDQTVLDHLGYQYRYDHRNRLIEKKIPGKDWEYIVYNKLDQPIMTQDANLRVAGQWLFTKYDAFGRVAYTGITKQRGNRDDVQEAVNNSSLPIYVSRTSNPNEMDNGLELYYTIDTYPTSSKTINTVNYYDDYAVGLASAFGYQDAYGQTLAQNTKSLATVALVRVLDTDKDWITTVSYYDTKARPIFVVSQNDFLQTLDWSKTQLDFVGKALQNTASHTKGSNTSIVTIDDFTYDHTGRLLTQSQRINNATPQLIVNNSYDALGQLVNKKVGGDLAATPQQSAGLQTVNYDYNIRGWLTQINDPDTALTDDLFAFKIAYNHPENGASTALFNGNIAETHWRSNNTTNLKRYYRYNYDALNRITQADNIGAGEYLRYQLKDLSYDKNGNVLSLVRQGGIVDDPDRNDSTDFGIMDNLTYTYQQDSNQLLGVQDSSTIALGFKDGANTGDDYTYDANGNMITDANKNIVGISYNHLNLPTDVFISGHGQIGYIYDATGVKLQKQVISTEGTISTSYAGTFIYEDIPATGEVLKFFSHPEGYYDVTTAPPLGELEGDYVFQYKDHLGNIRLSYSDSDGNGDIDAATEIIEENNYYPFGLEHKGYNNVVNGTENNYKTFQGQEKHEELGLNWSEFKYRFYDPSLARFHNVDPLAQEYAYQSPYNFSENRVIDGVELEGAERLSVHTPGWIFSSQSTIRNEHPTGAQMNTSTAAVVARHPIATSDVGAVERGGTNISSISGRIARHAASNGNLTVGEGSERNALRHATWVATITSNHGEGIAQRIGNAHEGIPIGAQGNAHVDFDQPAPDNLGGADSVVDFLNNEIGREIGASLGEGATEYEAAVAALGVQLNEGLFTATTDKDGNISISRTKITQKQYNTAIKTLRTLNRNGMNSEDRKALEEDKN